MRTRSPLLIPTVLLIAVLAACGSTSRKTAIATTTPAAAVATTTPAAGGAIAAGGSVSPVTSGAAPSAAAGAAATTPAPEAAVAGDIPDTQAFVAYSPAGGGYTIKVPEGWARTADGNATVFSDKFNTIRVETASLASAPTAASVTGTDVAAIAQTAKGYKTGKVSVVTRKSGQAVVATYQVDGAANAVTNKTVRLDVERYVFWKNSKAVIVTLSSAAGSDNVDPWKTVTDGFGWVG